MVFIGTYKRKVQRGGWVRFPKDWLTLLGNNRIFVMPDPKGGKSLLIVPAVEFNKELKRLSSMKAPKDELIALGKVIEQVEIAADGRMRISAKLLAYAGITGDVSFSGNMRTISLTGRSSCSAR